MTGWQSLIGGLAGALSLAGFGLYVWSTLFGRTRPNRATWWVLTLVGVMIASSYFAAGARNTIWIPVSYVAGPLIVALLSLKYGEGEWEALDLYCVIAAVISALVWLVFNAPLATLLINIGMDFIALIPTIKKSWARPDGEDRTAWALETAACALNVVAVESWVWGIALYPVYLVLMNGAITLLLYRGRFVAR